MSGLVRLIEKPEQDPIITVRESYGSNVVFAFWPRNKSYDHARRVADQYRANCLARAIEAPKPA